MKKRIHILMIAAAAALVAACVPSPTELNVDESQVQGLWQRSGTHEYWRYRADNSGVTWNTDDDVSEEESNLVYTWTITGGNVLRHVFTGLQGNQAVPKVYTISEISAAQMRLEDGYGLSYTLIKQADQ